MTDYSIEFNVYGAGDRSYTGHMNVTFRGPGTGPITIGANQNVGSLGLLFRGVGETSDGIFQREDSYLDRPHVTRGVPVTQAQFEVIRSAAESLVETRYDYAVFGNSSDPSQICSTWANDVYHATGHPGDVGVLFAGTDQAVVPGVIWDFVPGFVGIGSVAAAYMSYMLATPEYIPEGPVENGLASAYTFAQSWTPQASGGSGSGGGTYHSIDHYNNLGNGSTAVTGLPVILDLDGDGVELAVNSQASFDWCSVELMEQRNGTERRRNEAI